MNYEDNTYHFRQDSTFLYFFGLPYAGLAAIIDVDEDKEIIFGDELTMDHIVWMGIQPALCEKAQRVGVTETLSACLSCGAQIEAVGLVGYKAWHGTAVCSVYSWSREYEEL